MFSPNNLLIPVIFLSFITDVCSIPRSIFETRDDRCFPPPTGQIAIDSTCAQGVNVNNPNYDCQGGYFVQSSGSYVPCDDHSHCYPYVQPNEWCSIQQQGFQWTATGGCHCDKKLKTCLIQRQQPNELQWAYCTPREHFRCNARGHCSP